ncbi:class I adenylate-forming enzyme family protein [Roseomonas sp. CECT 9278]|uniref:class I adenylate-forming enzyme family protein n=1 Tax=Roseomonas sp. CECT 9278 TaxID=2845823 RepID=UPI001E65344E|nr:long-chain fatty acid--CoA ligase [Roseomonas sp. CECT 9278]CAH0153981.1 2-succinylbenzoate--CoA ligase [Roseomonas sp. CECT 9278]
MSTAAGNLTDRFHAVAAAAPGRVALSDAGGDLTYAQLRGAADVMAARMLDRGLRAGDVVQVQFQAPAFRLKVACAIGLARIGAIHAPLPPGSAARATPGLGAARFHIGDMLPDLPPGIAGIRLDIDELLRAAPPSGLPCTTDPGLPWLLARSSGTTGPPKAFLISHANEAARHDAQQGAIAILPGERFLGFVDPQQYIGLSYVLRCLRSGGTAIAADPQAGIAGNLRRIAARRVNYVSTAPAHLYGLAAANEVAGLALPDLRVLRVGSAAVSAPRLRHAMAHLTANIHVGYGSNEAGIIAVATPADLRRDPATCGRPLPGMAVRLLPAPGSATPGPCEIAVRSAGVVDRYLSGAADRDITQGWLRPGDLARIDDAGCIILQGRADDAINYGGTLISPQEIEAVLLDHPAVADAAAFAAPSALHQDLPHAAVVLRQPVDDGDLLAFCRARLGGKAPLAILRLAALPRNAMGKVLRRVLRDGGG